jgi:hypothetical protein
VAHPQTYGGRITHAPTSFLFRNEAASYGAKDTDSSSSFSVADGKRQTIPHDTSSLFLFRNETGSGTSRESERARSRSVTEAGGESSQGSRTGRVAGYGLAG